MTHTILQKPDDILQVNCEENGRSYKNGTGKSWKSVSFLSSYYEPKKYLNAWKKKVGFQEAAKITKEASANGTAIHAYCESFFTKAPISPLNDVQFATARNIEPFLKKAIPLALEHPIIWENIVNDLSIGFGGTLDGCFKLKGSNFVNDSKEPIFNGEAFVLTDFKTKKSEPKLEWMIKYYLQLAAYSAGLNKMSNCLYAINKGLIVVATPENIQLYYLNPPKMNWFWSNFKKILLAFYSSDLFNWNKFLEESFVFMPEKVYLVD